MEEQIKKYFEGELNTTEKLKFLKQVNSDLELKKRFIEYKNTYALFALSDCADNKKENKRAYMHFLQTTRKQKLYRIVLRTIGYAAAILLLVISTYMVTMNHVYSTMASTNTMYVPAGQRVKLTLQDGTSVWLNARTTLTYPIVFAGNERRVEIDGEAFFEVTKNTEKPFIVSSRGVDMKVLGTKFNVYSYHEEECIETSLLEGSLHVYFSNTKSNGVILKPNEQVIIKGNRMNVNKITHPDYFLWKDGIYSFDNELLIDILKKLELYYNIKIIVEDPSIFRWAYTGKFRQQDGIDEILHVINKIHKFSIKKDKENNTITLSR